MQTNTSSQVIRDLRLPLAIMVVFIHAFGQPTEYTVLSEYSGEINGMVLFDTLRILCSHVASHIAVPTFFLISGYLFFLKAEQLNWAFYKKQWKKRVKSLLVPYLLWNVLAVSYTVILKCAGMIIKGEPIDGIFAYLSSVCTPQIFWRYNFWGGQRTTVLQQVTDPHSGPYLIPMWFIRDLICVVIIAPILACLIKKTRGWVIALLAAVYLLKIQSPISDMFVTACFFFSIGAFFGLYKLDFAKLTSRYMWPAVILWIPLIVYNVYYDGSSSDQGLILYPLMVVIGVFTIIAIIARGYKLIPHWEYAARNTFFIFAAHGFIGMSITNQIVYRLSILLPQTLLMMSCRYLIVPFFAITICLATLYLLQRYMPRVASVLTGGR